MAAYQVATAADRRKLSDFLLRQGQFLLPMVKLIEQSEAAIEEVIDVTGRAAIEAVLEASALERAGDKSPGKSSGEIRWHGRQEGLAYLGQRKLRVQRPRLRHKDQGEVEIPAYEALKSNGRLARRMMSILLEGVSAQVPAGDPRHGRHRGRFQERREPGQHPGRPKAAGGTGRATF